jgi:hypothetical protein
MTMNMQIGASNLRLAGVVLLVGTALLLIGAMIAAYFRRFPLPTDPLEKLKLIVSDLPGWNAQAILFPVAMAIVAVSFGLIARSMPDSQAQRLAILATVLSTIAGLLWISISVYRLQLGAGAASMIATFDANAPPRIDNITWTFWPYTVATLGSIALMGAALALSGALPRLGWVAAAVAALSLVIVIPLWRDWPPFMSYLIALALGVGLVLSR